MGGLGIFSFLGGTLLYFYFQYNGLILIIQAPILVLVEMSGLYVYLINTTPSSQNYFFFMYLQIEYITTPSDYWNQVYCCGSIGAEVLFQGLVFEGFRVQVLGFRGLGFRVQVVGFGVMWASQRLHFQFFMGLCSVSQTFMLWLSGASRVSDSFRMVLVSVLQLCYLASFLNSGWVSSKALGSRISGLNQGWGVPCYEDIRA